MSERCKIVVTEHRIDGTVIEHTTWGWLQASYHYSPGQVWPDVSDVYYVRDADVLASVTLTIERNRQSPSDPLLTSRAVSP